MSWILNIETSGKNCSVALAFKGELKALKELQSEGYVHAEKLHLFIEQAVNEAGIEMKQLSAIAVSKGPGSYTGLRIGVSAAKGIAFALNIPIVAICSLYSLAIAAQEKQIKGMLCPMIDARRMEVYTCLFDENLTVLKEVSAEVVSEEFEFFTTNETIVYFGDGAQKCQNVLSENFVYLPGIELSAQQMVLISYEKFEQGKFEDLAYFEPFYLKDFIAGKPKKMF